MSSKFQRLQALIKSDMELIPTIPPLKDNSAHAETTETDISQDTGGDIKLTEASSSTTAPPSDVKNLYDNRHSVTIENSSSERRFIHVSKVTQSEDNSPETVQYIPMYPTLQRGELGRPNQFYCPIGPVSKYPYKFVKKDDQERIANRFFNQGQFWEREWELFYVWPQNEAVKPLILICDNQLRNLLHEINAEFPDLDLAITPKQQEWGLILKFPSHPKLLPRYLGQCHSKEEYNHLEANTPPASYRLPGEEKVPPPDKLLQNSFQRLVNDAVDLNKTRSKANRSKRKEERFLKQKIMRHQLKRAQSYLGLRPSYGVPENQHSEEVQTPTRAHDLLPIDTSISAPYPFENDVVFICVDIESYERDHSKITEIGISTLDVRDLADIPPGESAMNWIPKLVTRHFRITDHVHLKNTEFVIGCAERFRFGLSEFITLRDAPSIVASCFKPPYSAGTVDVGHQFDTPEMEKRKLVLVGHDVKQDINYLMRLGYNPYNLSNLHETLDTASMYRAWKREAQQPSLATTLLEFGITGWNLHNAGNDAEYTMQAFLAMSVKEAQLRGSEELRMKREKYQKEKIEEAIEKATQRVYEEADGWSSADDDHDDCNAPLSTESHKTKQDEDIMTLNELSLSTVPKTS